MNRSVLLALTAAAGFSLAACGSSPSASPSTAAGGASAAAEAGASAGAGAAGSKNTPHKLAFIQLQSAPLSSEIALGATAAASEVGSTVTTQGPATLNPSAATAALASDVSAGYQGVVADAYPSGLWVKPLANASAGGIAVATLDAGSPASVAKFHTGASVEGKGAALAQDFAKVLGPNAKGYIQPGICVPGLDVLTPAIAGFKAEMTRLEPGVTVKDAFDSTGQPATNFSAWSREIAQEPDALGFFGVCDQDAPSLIKVKQASSGSKFLVGTMSGDSVATIKAVQDGTMTAVVGQNGFVQGYLSFKYLLQHLNTKSPMPSGWLNSGVDNITQDRAADAIAVRQTNTPQAYLRYYSAAISAAQAQVTGGKLPEVAAQLTTLSP